MAQISYPLDDTLYAAADVQIWLSTRTQGVFSSDNDLILKPVTDFDLSLSPGLAWIKTGRFENAAYANTETLEFTAEIADGLMPRIDRLVIRWDKVANLIEAQLKTGVPSAAPVAPALQRDAEAYELGLYDIRIRPGALQLRHADIKDLRHNEILCGIMRDGVSRIPTQQLYDQWDSWYRDFTIDAQQQIEDKTSEFTDRADELKAIIETLFDESSENFESFNLYLQSFMEEAEREWEAWLLDKAEQLAQYPAGEWMEKVERLIAAAPTFKLPRIERPDNIRFTHVWQEADTLFAPLEQWGFKDAADLEVSALCYNYGDGTAEVLVPERLAADDWKIFETEPLIRMKSETLGLVLLIT